MQSSRAMFLMSSPKLPYKNGRLRMKGLEIISTFNPQTPDVCKEQ